VAYFTDQNCPSRKVGREWSCCSRLYCVDVAGETAAAAASGGYGPSAMLTSRSMDLSTLSTAGSQMRSSSPRQTSRHEYVT